MAECKLSKVSLTGIRKSPFTKKPTLGTIHKYKRNRNRKLRRKRNNIKYFEKLRALRIDRNSEELCSSVSVVNITDMNCAPEKFYVHPPKEISEWQYQHQLAYWKSRAISLEYENRMLHQHIKTLYAKQIEEYAQLVQAEHQVDDAEARETDSRISNPKCYEQEIKELAEIQRQKDLECLYGDMAPKINGMETAMKVSYDLQVDKYNPPHWPNLPLNL